MIGICIDEWIKAAPRASRVHFLLKKGMKKKEREATINSHIPVLLDEAIHYLAPKPGGNYVDGTLGAGGHAAAISAKITAAGTLIGIDKDQTAIHTARQKLEGGGCTFHFVQDDFKNIKNILTTLKIKHVNGILLDLGISSLQLDDAQRGFSLRSDGPLDMRMDKGSPLSAYDLINSLSEKEINAILKDFGEERFHNRIARKIIETRSLKPIESTRELRHIIMKAMPFNRSRTRVHPATRTFQALRIAVNHELESIADVLQSGFDVLAPGGRFVVIAFHSLEDRLVKVKFREWDKENKVKILTKKPLFPTDAEIEANPRSRSARLRAVERI